MVKTGVRLSAVLLFALILLRFLPAAAVLAEGEGTEASSGTIGAEESADAGSSEPNEENSSVFSEPDSSESSETSSSDPDSESEKDEAVLIGSNGMEKYSGTILTLFLMLEDGDTVKLLRDTTMEKHPSTEANYTFDLNGHKITMDKGLDSVLVIKGSTTNLISSEPGGEINMGTNFAAIQVISDGTLNLEDPNVTIKGTKSISSFSSHINLDKATINGSCSFWSSEVLIKGGTYRGVIDLHSSTTLTIEGGIFQSSLTSEDAICTIRGGMFYKTRSENFEPFLPDGYMFRPCDNVEFWKVENVRAESIFSSDKLWIMITVLICLATAGIIIYVMKKYPNALSEPDPAKPGPSSQGASQAGSLAREASAVEASPAGSVTDDPYDRD